MNSFRSLEENSKPVRNAELRVRFAFVKCSLLFSDSSFILTFGSNIISLHSNQCKSSQLETVARTQLCVGANKANNHLTASLLIIRTVRSNTKLLVAENNSRRTQKDKTHKLTLHKARLAFGWRLHWRSLLAYFRRVLECSRKTNYYHFARLTESNCQLV